MIKSRNKRILIMIIIPLVICASLLILWITGILPSGISILVANKYVHEHYSERDFKYQSVEYADGFGVFIVRYVDKDGKIVSFPVSPIGFHIAYDPLNLP